MGEERKCKKHPCRICRKWFLPNPRLGARQKTCGATECQQQWHARKCAEWNRKNRSYFTEVYISRRLESTAVAFAGMPPSLFPTSGNGISSPRRSFSPHFPQAVVQEVIGVQQLVIIEYIMRLLRRSLQEEMRAHLGDIHEELRRLPRPAISRGDSQRSP